MPVFYDRTERKAISKKEKAVGYCPFCDTSPEQKQYHVSGFENEYFHLRYNGNF